MLKALFLRTLSVRSEGSYVRLEGCLSSSRRLFLLILKALLSRHVIRLGLCPFAKPAMETGKVRFKIASGVRTEEDALRLLLEEADLVIRKSEEDLPTTLIAFPDLYPDDFLE